MIAGSSAATVAAANASLSASVLRHVSHPVQGGPTTSRALNVAASANFPVSPLDVIAATAPECRTRYATSRSVSMVMHGMGIAPSLRQAVSAICHSGMRGSITTTRSPFPTPRAASRFATRLAVRATSPKVSRRSLPPASHQTSASFDESRAQASTTSAPKLNVAGVSSRCPATARS